ncbi:hypothetical protein KKF38_04395 [Patescibacteria group bacterium]|nr:hypothetical protein [Patescibacteria group bacterium]
MQHQSPPPNPADFPTFEEYEAALRMREKFLAMSEEVSKVVNESKTEEEFNREMEKLGFTCHQDEFCGEGWCKKHEEECLAIALEYFQDEANADFFFGVLPEKEKILQGDFSERMCDLPSEWKDSKTREGKVVEFCLDFWDALVFKNSLGLSCDELVKEEEIQKIGRILYFVLQKTLFRKAVSKEIEQVRDFLHKNKFLNLKISRDFSKKLENIQLS